MAVAAEVRIRQRHHELVVIVPNRRAEQEGPLAFQLQTKRERKRVPL
jgi:hypothetical protein